MMIHNPEIPGKHILVQLPTNSPVYTPDTIDALTEWTKTRKIFYEVNEVARYVQKRDSEQLTYSGLLEDMNLFMEKCLPNRAQQMEFRRCFGR
jgi:hypothetical protein